MLFDSSGRFCGAITTTYKAHAQIRSRFMGREFVEYILLNSLVDWCAKWEMVLVCPD